MDTYILKEFSSFSNSYFKKNMELFKQSPSSVTLSQKKSDNHLLRYRFSTFL